ncbi:hypothetical protein [Promicromonospora sp. NPDC023805]|uniref:hypothetical protein n=1 Tax=Promicromonospora sp. NPDC023805 TaxID=3154696 RepID=UPI0033FD0E34
MSDQPEAGFHSLPIDEPQPMGHSRFVTRAEFAGMSEAAPDVSLAAFRSDQDAIVEG